MFSNVIKKAKFLRWFDFGLFSRFVFFIFLGFVLGNFFQTACLPFLIHLNGFLPNLFLFFSLVVYESLNHLVYAYVVKQPESVFGFWNLTNVLKMGWCLGFFTDAFKVGS